MGNTRTPRQIAILAYPGVQSLDVTGPLEAFAGAQQLIEGRASGERPYEVRIVARRRAPLLTLGSHEPQREAQRAVLENAAAVHTVEAMAARTHMSPRHFARAFRAETGLTPARYVERVRLEAARRRLEEGSEPIAAVAGACGFGTAETMRRAFLRALEVGPAEYRRRFQGRAAA